MELVYTDAAHVAQGYVSAFELDMAFGADENDFVLTVPPTFEVEENAYIFEPDSELGGIVKGYVLKTSNGQPVKQVTGVTWHGLLAQRVIRPATGQDYFTVSGDANACISETLANIGLASVFAVSPAAIKSISYQHERYVDGYYGIAKMLSSNGLKLKITARPDELPMLEAVPIGVYVDDGATNGCGFKIVRNAPVNHLVCLGKGELRERVVIDLYADENGNVSQSQSLFGLREIADTYEQSSQEYDELLADGTKKLRELQEREAATLELPEGVAFDVGDVVGVVDYKSGVSLSATLTKVIVKVDEYGNVRKSNEIGKVKEVA